MVGSPASAQQAAGVVVDPAGVLRIKVYDNALTRERVAAARAQLAPNLARPSDLRKVSLNRLEAALASGAPLSEEMQNLAGLTAITHVFFYPESGDIVVAGPAEGFALDATGRSIGIATGKATLQLEDLVVAMRAYPPAGGKQQVISVSIDPTQEGLLNMQKFLARIAGRVRPGDANRIVTGLRESLGLQEVTVQGVSPQTHFAQVLVEADYRMKLIGIGIEQPPVKITSYVQRANPRDVSRNAMQRWFFTPNYECVKVSEDHLAMQLVGEGVKLISEDELVTAQGGRVINGLAHRASEAYVKEFTAKYPELARKSPVYAQMRSLIDMSIAAAFIQQQDWYAQAGWEMAFFADEKSYPVEVHQTPKHVESACTAVWKGNTLMTPIGGGVNIQPLLALAGENLLTDAEGKVYETRKNTSPAGLAQGQWWWD
jgi:hypothetical protein